MAVAFDEKQFRLPRGAMTWVTWRQHRAALLAVTGALAAFAIALLISGLRLHSDFDRMHLAACTQYDDGICSRNADELIASVSTWTYPIFLLTFMPGVIGAFVGAPLLAREFETGSYRYTWTQGMGKTRWLASKMLLLALAIVVMTGAFSALIHWWDAPLATLESRMRPRSYYEVDGLVFAARSLAAFAAGAFFGAVLRRTVPAMAATLATYIGLWYTSADWIRGHLMTPVGRPYQDLGPRTGWLMDKWLVDSHGHSMTIEHWRDQYDAALRSGANMAEYVKTHTYTLWGHYQPANRFWAFQAMEAGGTLVVAMAFAAATLWWVRRRVA